MSYLDDPRVYFAAERTLLAWNRTAMGMVALGFALERFGMLMKSAFPVLWSRRDDLLSLGIGASLLVMAAILSIAASVNFTRFVKRLSPKEVPPGHWTHMGPVVSVVLAGMSIFLLFVLFLPR